MKATERRAVAYGYVRVSTARQAEGGHSVENQKASIEAYIASQLPAGSLNGGVFIDTTTGDRSGVSGRVPFSKRPAGGQLLARLKRGDHVVMLDVARGFRSFRDAIATLEDWIEGGITVHLVRDKITTGTAPGRLYIRLMAQFAQVEREMISERTREVMQHRKRIGKAAGAPPMGHRYHGPKGNKTLVVDPREVETMNEIVRMHDVLNMNFDQIWLAMRAAKIKREGGKSWSRSRVYRGYKAAKAMAAATPESSAAS